MFILTVYDHTQKSRSYKGPTGPFTTDRNAVEGWDSVEEATKAADHMREYVSLETDIWLETR